MSDDPLISRLAALPPRDLDAARASHLRGRCHGALRQATAQRAAPGPRLWVWGRALEPALVTAVCALYLGWAFSQAMALY